MTPAMCREYGFEASPDRTPGASNTLAKNPSRALLRIPSWDSLPICTYSERNHNHLPELLCDLMKRCEEGSHSGGSNLCPVPGFFALHWTEFECLYCEVHRCIVPGEHIWSHVSRRHKGAWKGITKSTVLEGFLGHIQRCYPAIVSQLTKNVKKSLPDRLQAPLPFAPVSQRYRCSVPGCNTWSSPNSEHKKHLRSCHELSGAEYVSAESIDPQWTQRIGFCEVNKTGSRVVFIVPHHPDSDSPAFPLRPPTLAEHPRESSWTITLGWDVELTRISKALGVSETSAIATLRDLVDLPSQHRISGAKTDALRLVEKGLWVLNKLSLRTFRT